MNKETKKWIERYIEKIIAKFKFENLKESDFEFCPCFKEGKCHELPEMNCFLCYCPNYDNLKDEGGCKINNPKGKWFDNGNGARVWDCSECDWPHNEKNVRTILRRLFSIDDKAN